MPIDVSAAVISNVRLSDDYNVLSLAAPEIGEQTRPGQFVMVKAGPMIDSILRRPFSVFEVLRDAGRVTGLSLLNKRAGQNTRALYAVEPAVHVSCLGPLGRPFTTISEPQGDGGPASRSLSDGLASRSFREGWMVAGGVGLAPFATLAESLAAAGTRTTLFYGARSARELFYLEFFERLGVRLVLATEDGSRGFHGRVTLPLEQELAALPHPGAALVYACGPEPMLQAVATLAARYRQPSEVSVERTMGCGLGGCYSCVIPVRHDGDSRYVRSCIGGPVFSGADIVWDRC
ncbi:MAG TPA: dihydroorotate dehydrogenase electron transfer subunit [Vicinamibacterales bacterium]|nr:dihydroorotate dehydrogenase electron transfer subunit [Vicinamibacterales bacterium]